MLSAHVWSRRYVHLFRIQFSLIQLSSFKALRDAQNLVVQLKQENRRLSLRVAELELTKGKSTTGSTGDSNVAKNSVVTSAGTSFQFLYSPFPTTDLFSAEHPKPLFGPFDIIRYSNLDNKELGPVAEIFTHIDSKYHELMIDGDEFATLVSHIFPFQ